MRVVVGYEGWVEVGEVFGVDGMVVSFIFGGGGRCCGHFAYVGRRRRD